MPTLLIVLAIAVVLVSLSLRVVKEYDPGVRGPGLIILIPILEQMTRVSLRTITMNIPSQKIIPKDNVSIDIAAVAYAHIVDPVALQLRTLQTKAEISVEKNSTIIFPAQFMTTVQEEIGRAHV